MVSGLYPNQGFLQIINNGIIENAEEAFANSGGSDAWNTGGVIDANTAIFRNCRRSAGFIKYQNTQAGGAVAVDKSQFIDTKFLIDKTIHHNSAMVTMWAVRGVAITGCQFINTSTLDNAHEKGIFTIDASYTIANSAKNNTLFTGLEGGINSLGYTWDNKLAHPIVIKDALFDKNEIGIDIKDMMYPIVIGNTMNTGMIQHPYNANGDFYPTIGARFVDVQDFIYCSNRHSRPYATPNTNVTTWNCGLDITNSGADDMVIEKNNFDKMQVGTDICRINANAEEGTGTVLRWNKNQNNSEYDFVFADNCTLRPIQSADLTNNMTASGNTFTGGNTRGWWHLSGGNEPVDYYYNAANANENPLLVGHLNVNGIASTTILQETPECASYQTVHKAGQRQMLSSELDVLKNNYYTAAGIYNTLHAMHNIAIDGGNTVVTINEIENKTSAQAMQLRADMLAKSPYLSLDVLEKLASENILSQAVLLEIIMANPDASQNESFMKYLRYAKPNPMPNYMITMIRSSWNGNTLRSALEQNMANHHMIMTQNRNEILMALRLDSLYYNEDSIYEWLTKVPSLGNEYEIIEYLLSNKNYGNAEVRLNAIPNTYPLSNAEVDNYTAYQTFYNFKKMLLQANIEINKLDSPRIASLKAIADNAKATNARSMARNAMCFFYNTCYANPIKTLPNASGERMVATDETEMQKDITVYPNPAKEFVVFAYNLATDNTVTEINITDIVGKPIYKSVLSGKIGQHVWDTKIISNGNYIYNITTSNGQKFSGNIVVQK